MKYLLIFFISINAFSQEYSKLVKNINIEAKDLYHDLNTTKDSLIIKGTNIHLISIIRPSKEVSHFRNTDIPLFNFNLGNHTVMVYKDNKIIVFTLVRLLLYKKEQKERIIFEKDIKIKKKRTPYNLNSRNRVNVQSRAEYRKNNLRPNGKPYN